MGDARPTKPKRTLSKIGRLLGVSSTNLAQNGQDHKHAKEPVTLESLSIAAHADKNDTSLPQLPQLPRSKSPVLPPPDTHMEEIDVALDGQADDVLFPLPNDRSRTTLPHATGAALSPAQSLVSIDLVHPQPHSAPQLGLNGNGEHNGSARSPPVSRLSSVVSHVRKNGSANQLAGQQPPLKTRLGSVSRSSSVKKQSGQPSPGNLSPSVSTTHLPGLTAGTATASNKPRFKMFEDGSHEHNLRAAKRQEKLSNMLKDLLGAKKLRDEAKSAVPNILLPAANNKQEKSDKPPTLFAGLVSQVKNNTSPYHHQGGELLGPIAKQDCRSFVEKYGRCQEVIGKGSFGVVRISHKKAAVNSTGQPEVLYAVKEFKRRPAESEKKYSRRLTSEFCISSSLKHSNIIDTLDLLKDAKGDYCEVMEFCSGGDLYTLIIAAGKLEYAEADCFFKQLVRGVNYMHDMGVAHRDLKPENLLLTQQGVLKITDFGNGECFKMAWEDEIQLSEGISGSSPYIAPEEFTQEQFDPRCVDIWACGVIYMAMRTGRQLWKTANPKCDEFFEEYLVKRKDATGYEPIESLKRARCRNVIYSILDPIPERRITGKQILNSEWGREIKVCAAGDGRLNESPVEKVPEIPEAV